MGGGGVKNCPKLRDVIYGRPLTWLWWFGLRQELLTSGNDRAAQKIVAHIKVVKSETKIIFLLLLPIFNQVSPIHSVSRNFPPTLIQYALKAA